MNLFMIDGTGAFFKGAAGRRVNWSKAPFSNLEKDGMLDPGKAERIQRDFRDFVERTCRLGFNAVTIDDCAHLFIFDNYSKSLKRKISEYRELYRELNLIAHSAGMQVFYTTDIPFFEKDATRREAADIHSFVQGFCMGLTEIFTNLPYIEGIIVRIGECDAPDVVSDFEGRIGFRRPSDVRTFLDAALPVFERFSRLLVFRTWTVGVGRVGDLMWNGSTYHAVFDGIDSESLVLSMKQGESDFFRYQTVNPHFFRDSRKKILEIQARREYEGFGEYPSFIGWDCEKARRELDFADNLIGISVWCQTGGWSVFKNITFLENSSVWNELNVYVALRLFKERIDTEEAIKDFCARFLSEKNFCDLVTMMRLSDESIKELLYIDEFARRKMYYRRVRVPALLAVYWDHIFVNHTMKRILKCFVLERQNKIVQGYAVLGKIRKMISIARSSGLPDHGLVFQMDTFRVLAASREYYFGEYNPEFAKTIERLSFEYMDEYPGGYSIRLDFSEAIIPKSLLKLMFNMALRKDRGYRFIDRLMMMQGLSIFSPMVKISAHVMPDFAEERAMGIKSVTE